MYYLMCHLQLSCSRILSFLLVALFPPHSAPVFWSYLSNALRSRLVILQSSLRMPKVCMYPFSSHVPCSFRRLRSRLTDSVHGIKVDVFVVDLPDRTREERREREVQCDTLVLRKKRSCILVWSVCERLLSSTYVRPYPPHLSLDSSSSKRMLERRPYLKHISYIPSPPIRLVNRFRAQQSVGRLG